jgi:hypothetical protein
MDFLGVRDTVRDVIEAMWATPPDAGLFPRDWWPGASCENVAVAVAAVLEDRGHGQWTFDTAGQPGEVAGHAWLEYRDTAGATLFSIDPTLHQFAEWDNPFVGEGQTPAASLFTLTRWEGIIWDWPYLGTEDQIFRRLIRAVRDELRVSR